MQSIKCVVCGEYVIIDSFFTLKKIFTIITFYLY